MTEETKLIQPLDVLTCPFDCISNIEASAGTGKTWAICGLYLRLLLEHGLTVDQILVVTFTNAATAELRSRIRNRLIEVLRVMETGRNLSGDPFAQDFVQHIRELGGEVAEQAGNRLKLALSSFEQAAIFTIHSFCQRALGEAPFAASQPFRVEVEANDGEIIREIAADYWRRIVNEYAAHELKVLMDQGIDPDWLAGEFKRVLNRPKAAIMFNKLDHAAALDIRRSVWLKRILLCVGPSAIRATKRRRRVISYSDMLYNIYEALTCGRFPWLAATLRSRFPAALIDEFQDTDPLQFDIFRSIYSDSGTLFLVGDPKQAIYAFRNADLNTYLIAKRCAQQQWTLLENQRSEPALISAANALFGINKQVFCSPDIQYQNIKRGRKSLKLLSGDPEHRHPLSVWLFPPGTKGSSLAVNAADNLALQATAWEMSRLLAGGRRGDIKIGDQPLQLRDIAVLVRTKSQGQTVKAALAECGIGSVDLTEQNVFATLEAEEMERVLRAIAEPMRTGLVRAALSTVLIGKDSMAIAALNADEIAFNHIIERMERYRQQWMHSGFGAMWRTLLLEEKVVERLLPLPGGERRVTNLMHLAELLVSAAEKRHGIESLLRWLGEQRTDPAEDEEVTQLRLESDENLVQIVTKHRAKGLEWSVVFCPFIWRERMRSGGDRDVFIYHEDDRMILDYTKSDTGKSRQEEEGRAERVRLIYVALTRAINRCYIAAGPFWQTWGRYATETRARKSIMNWIVAGSGSSPWVWGDNKKVTVAAIHQAWQELLAKGEGIGLIPWPSGSALRLPSTDIEKAYEARAVGRLPKVAWQLSSYTALSESSQDIRTHREAEVHDFDFAAVMGEDHGEGAVSDQVVRQTTSDIVDFPTGATAGHCLHMILDRIDFQDAGRWDEIINATVAAYPPESSGESKPEYLPMIREMLSNVLRSPLPGGFALCEVAAKKRLSELEFSYPVENLNAGRLQALMAKHGRRLPPLNFRDLKGYLRGFMDLVFEHNGKWFVLDWKSNKLGLQAEDYNLERLDREMYRHCYELQGLIYLAALHRYLKFRIPNYDYKRYIGGILYLFIRGVRLQWPAAGIWHALPDQGLVDDLDVLFSPKSEREGGRLS
ncbi:MAG TPA: UvrD-helicase domain-containing protein [Syntrophales bacterium]|nr:UvrD-helicase domain-containing protein [Syntrophales bacterium]